MPRPGPALGAGLRARRRFSGLVAIQPWHALLTTEIYDTIRHPSYPGLLVNALGWALAVPSSVGVLRVAIAPVPVRARITSGERLLQAWSGAEYGSYCTRTWRLVPFVY